jgi:CheY-like chemotaxis protein
VADFVAAAREACEPLLRERNHELTVQLPPQPLWVMGDAVRLAQVVSNLLNNAGRYTEPGGRVRIEVEAQGAHAVLRVSDTGRGFAAPDRERIFGLFARGEGSGGLGIGLALGRRLAQMHGGALEGDSEGPGRGAVFTLRLPLAQSPVLPADPAKPADAGLRALRVLVVDDNADAADTLQLLLSELGAQVSVARSGTDALAQFALLHPSVVLLDIGMPGMDGYEVARRLRKQFADSRFAIVGLSGWGQARDRVLGREAGFDHHLVKPAELGALRALLDTLQR